MRFCTGLTDIGCASQGNEVVGRKRDQQHAERAGTLRLCHALLMECLGNVLRRLAWLAVNPPRHGL